MQPATRLVALVFLVVALPLASWAADAPSGQNTSPTRSNILNKPNDFPIPTEPSFGLPNPNRGVYGKVVRYLRVPPRQVILSVYVPGPGSVPGQYQQQVVEIPGYVVTETTTGYLYPVRLSLQQVAVGMYRWVRAPQQFRRK